MSTSPELHGWDDIAKYLGVTRRTAQNYERDYGLPVNRMPGPKGRVWAVVSEIEQWKTTLQAGPACCPKPSQEPEARADSAPQHPTAQGTIPPTQPVTIPQQMRYAGYLQHMVTASALYGLNYVAMLLIEVAYQFDRFGPRALAIAPIAFIVAAGSLLAIFWRAPLNQGASNKNRTAFSLLLLILAAAVVYGMLCLSILPNHAVTQNHTTGWTARLAYLKDILYILPIAIFYIIVPVHFIAAMRRELAGGERRTMAALLAGHKLAVAPAGTWYVRHSVLWAALLAVLLLFIPMTWHLLDSLELGPYTTLFSTLIFVRLGLYFTLACEALLWYGHRLAELKQECLLAPELREHVYRQQPDHFGMDADIGRLSAGYGWRPDR